MAFPVQCDNWLCAGEPCNEDSPSYGLCQNNCLPGNDCAGGLFGADAEDFNELFSYPVDCLDINAGNPCNEDSVHYGLCQNLLSPMNDCTEYAGGITQEDLDTYEVQCAIPYSNQCLDWVSDQVDELGIDSEPYWWQQYTDADWWVGDNSLWDSMTGPNNQDWWFGDNSLYGNVTDREWWFGDNSLFGNYLNGNGSSSQTNNNTMLLIGGAVLLFFLMKGK